MPFRALYICWFYFKKPGSEETFAMTFPICSFRFGVWEIYVSDGVCTILPLELAK